MHVVLEQAGYSVQTRISPPPQYFTAQTTKERTSIVLDKCTFRTSACTGCQSGCSCPLHTIGFGAKHAFLFPCAKKLTSASQARPARADLRALSSPGQSACDYVQAGAA